MQEGEDANHEGAEELVEELSFREQRDQADDGAERGDLDVGAGRREAAQKRRVKKAFVVPESVVDEKTAVVWEPGEDKRGDLAALVFIGGDGGE